jgi:hypothetical protein
MRECNDLNTAIPFPEDDGEGEYFDADFAKLPVEPVVEPGTGCCPGHGGIHVSEEALAESVTHRTRRIAKTQRGRVKPPDAIGQSSLMATHGEDFPGPFHYFPVIKELNLTPVNFSGPAVDRLAPGLTNRGIGIETFDQPRGKASALIGRQVKGGLQDTVVGDGTHGIQFIRQP